MGFAPTPGKDGYVFPNALEHVTSQGTRALPARLLTRCIDRPTHVRVPSLPGYVWRKFVVPKRCAANQSSIPSLSPTTTYQVQATEGGLRPNSEVPQPPQCTRSRRYRPSTGPSALSKGFGNAVRNPLVLIPTSKSHSVRRPYDINSGRSGPRRRGWPTEYAHSVLPKFSSKMSTLRTSWIVVSPLKVRLAPSPTSISEPEGKSSVDDYTTPQHNGTAVGEIVR